MEIKQTNIADVHTEQQATTTVPEVRGGTELTAIMLDNGEDEVAI